MKTLLTTLALLASLGTAHSDGYSGNDWMAHCNSKALADKVACNYFAFGVGAGLRLWSTSEDNNAGICVPYEVEAGQLVAVGQKYFRENPKLRHQGAHVFLGHAYKDAWPCE